jgi:hypothetical protein
MVRLKALAALACLALAASGLSACQDDVPLPNSDVDYCTIVADPPTKDGSHIAAPTHFTCDGLGPSSITLTVSLEKQESHGSWKKLRSGTFVVHGSDTVRTKSIDDRTRRVSSGCSSGTFRTVFHAVEKSKGHKQVYDNHSVTVPKPCDETF